MSRTRKVADRSKIKEKMSTYMMLMGYHGDYQATVAKDLNRQIWLRKGKLSRKRIRRLLYLLHVADSCSLLCYTVSLGRLIWSDHLRAKRRKFEKKLAEKIKRRSVKKKCRRGRAGPVRARARRGSSMVKKPKERKWSGGVQKSVCQGFQCQNGCLERKGNGRVLKFRKGYQMRPVLGSTFRVVVRHRVRRRHPKAEFGSPMYRLAMAMSVLSFRNVYITSEWEFWVIWFIQQVCGFWRSITLGEGLSDSLVSIARKFGLRVVPSELYERMESCYGCSSSGSYPGSQRIDNLLQT